MTVECHPYGAAVASLCPVRHGTAMTVSGQPRLEMVDGQRYRQAMEDAGRCSPYFCRPTVDDLMRDALESIRECGSPVVASRGRCKEVTGVMLELRSS